MLSGICANRVETLIRIFLFVLFMFFSFSYRHVDRLAGESFLGIRWKADMTDQFEISEQHIRAGLSTLLNSAAQSSGRPRCAIAREANLHRDALRRVLKGERNPTVSEVLRILSASGAAPHAHMTLCIAGDGDRAAEWLQTDLALFFDAFVRELPAALEQQLGNQLHDIKPRWARGTAQRVARLLAEHIDELARKDALLAHDVPSSAGGANA
ncbi:hypothetical protein [Parasphingorhabdus sp.]|uniref:hypothetical protein n=1 Tax=Parasphingorhabdus sp. TaxID=2709688 RepID=UPI003D2713C8